MRQPITKFILLLLLAGFTAGCASLRCKCPKVRYEQPGAGMLPGSPGTR